MSHEIFLKYFIEYLFFLFNTWFRYWIVWYFVLYSILCKLYILWIGVLDWHIHCARVWYEIIKIVEQSLDFHLGSCKCFDEVENVSSNFFLTDTGFCSEYFEICTISLFSFGWWYTLMKNTHQISLYLGLKKMANILQITFSNGFSFKKNYCLSFYLSLSLSVSVCLSVCLSVCACHTFFTMFPSWYHHEIFRSDYQWQKWCLCKSSRSEVKSQCYRGQNPN